jgi:hypothetical protein
VAEQGYFIDLGRNAKEVVAEGMHLCEIAGCDSKQSSSGNAYLSLRFKIIGDSDPDQGKSVWGRLMLTPASRWKLEEFLDAVVAPTAGRWSPDKFLGKVLKVQVTHEEYQGETRANVDKYFPTSAAGAAPKAAARKGLPTITPKAAPVEEEDDEDDEVQEVKAAKPARTAAPKKAAAPAPAEEEDDDDDAAEEEAAPPARSKGGKPAVVKAAPGKKNPSVSDDDEEDDEEEDAPPVAKVGKKGFKAPFGK